MKSLRYRFIFPTSFVAGGMLFFVPIERWRSWNRDIWKTCACAGAVGRDQR